MRTLKDLLEHAKVIREARSGRHLAEIAVEHGYSIDRTLVAQILNGKYKYRPGRPLLEAIAWLAQVDVEVAYEAAHIPLPGPPFVDELPPDVDTLSPSQRQAVVEVVRSFLKTNAEHAEKVAAADPALVKRRAERLLTEAGGNVFDAFDLWANTPDGKAVLDEIVALWRRQNPDTSLASAANAGTPIGSEVRQRQDEAGERPDPEGPEAGA